MSTWNYRLMRHKIPKTGETYLAMHGVYSDDGNPNHFWTSDPIPVTTMEQGQVEDMRQTLTLMLEACDKPILNAQTGREE